MSNEKTPINKVEYNEASKELESIRQEAQENIDKQANREREQPKAEAQAEKLEKARHEALEKAHEIEKDREKAEKKTVSHEKKRGPVSKKERKAAFNKTMAEVRSEMSPASRTFSKIIHNPAIEKTSEVVGSTIARPNAILSGSVMAFVLTAGVYLVAKHFGYVLSGTETIAAFILGWTIGIIYDYIRVLIFGKERL